jgi:hypothetical protein
MTDFFIVIGLVVFAVLLFFVIVPIGFVIAIKILERLI